jgi:hypothetical protein
MTKENKLITLAAVSTEFTDILCREIDRIKKGGKWEWDGNGLHTKLMMDEARKLVRGKAYQFKSLSLDQANAMTILAQYPEALERMTFASAKPLSQAIVHAVEEVILDQVFTDEHKAIVLQQWNGTRTADVLPFIVEAALKYKRVTDRTIDHLGSVATADDLESMAATVFELREGFHNANMDDDYSDEVRRADEYLEFFEFVKAGEIAVDAVLGQENAVGMAR